MVFLRSKRSWLIILSLAFFSFIFLGSEYYFDAIMANVTDAAGIVNAQNIVLGASVIGFVLPNFNPVKLRKYCVIPIAAVYVVMMILMTNLSSYPGVLATGIIAFIMLGTYGTGVCYQTIAGIEDMSYLARTVGIAYALGVLFQYINNNLVKSEPVQLVVLVVTASILSGMAYWGENALAKRGEIQINADMSPERRKSVKASLVGLTVLVALMTVIFSTLDNAVTLVHTSGEFNIGQWPRLLLAISGLIAGILFDIKDRKLMVPMMYVVTILSTISIVIIKFGGTFIIGLIVFYVAAGFLVVFFMTGYMDMATYTTRPVLWAGLGRAVNNLCAFITTFMSVKLLENGNLMGILICAIVLFLAISVVTAEFLYGRYSYRDLSNFDRAINNKEKTHVKTFEDFSAEHKLTEREKEVLQALLASDEDVIQIAQSLAISRTALYRHISSMNEKTDSKSRVGLIQYYYNWMSQ